MLIHSLLVGTGGFLGALLRYGTSVLVLRHWPGVNFPWATFGVNLVTVSDTILRHFRVGERCTPKCGAIVTVSVTIVRFFGRGPAVGREAAGLGVGSGWGGLRR